MESLNKALFVLNSLVERCANSRSTLFDASSLSYKILSIDNNILEIKIENRSNNYYEIDLNTNDILKMYRAEARQYEDYLNYVRLLKKAKKENAVVVAGKLCHVKNEPVKSWHTRPMAKYVIQTDGRYRGTWFGANAEDALNNAIPFLKDIPTTIAVIK